MKATPLPKLSIIVVSYNTRDMTLACVRSVIAETTKVTYELIVLDNASIDGSAEAIADEFGGQLRLIKCQKNRGFAVGNNLAAMHARGQFLLLLNPDTIILDRAIDRIYEFAQKHPNAQIWGGRTVFEDGSLNPASCWARQTLWSLTAQAVGLSSLLSNNTWANPEGIGSWDRAGIRHVDIVAGCFLLLTRELWLILEGFGEEYFMYGEDADLCLRARHHGARPLATGAATIVHYGGASENVQSDKLVRLLNAKSLLIHRHFPGLRSRLGLRLLTFWPLSRLWVHTLLAALGRKASRVEKAVWYEVWTRRKSYTNSFS